MRENSLSLYILGAQTDGYKLSLWRQTQTPKHFNRTLHWINPHMFKYLSIFLFILMSAVCVRVRVRVLDVAWISNRVLGDCNCFLYLWRHEGRLRESRQEVASSRKRSVRMLHWRAERSTKRSQKYGNWSEYGVVHEKRVGILEQTGTDKLGQGGQYKVNCRSQKYGGNWPEYGMVREKFVKVEQRG